VTEKYLIGAEQGRDLLNSVRAARDIPQAGAGTRFALYGHSQGGLVALWGLLVTGVAFRRGQLSKVAR